MNNNGEAETPTNQIYFAEILLEEYEGLNQPGLDEAEVREIRKQLNDYRNTVGCPRREPQPVFEGRILKRIYRLIYEAQERTAKQTAPSASEKDSDAKEFMSQAGALASISDISIGLTNLNGNLAGYHGSIIPEQREKLTACTLRSALCLSGGGVRSATFNLGILQGLARHGLLERFDYLSTVSGGGFIGGWLSAWIRRQGIDDVVNELANPPKTPLTPDPNPVEHLRIYSNYLSPRPGLLSADTWTLVASVVRNLVLNWLVFVPVFLAALLVPRMWTSALLSSANYRSYTIPISLAIGFLSGLWALSYIGRNLPSVQDYRSVKPNPKCYKVEEGKFISRCLIWLVVSAAALAMCLWSCCQPDSPALRWYYYPIFLAVTSLLAWISSVWKISKITPKEKKDSRYLRMLLKATGVIVLLVPLILGLIVSYVISRGLPTFHQHPVIYSVFAVPVLLLLMGIKGVLITGFTSRFSRDQDQEWWARAGGWVLIVVLAWSVIHLLVLYGPVLLLTLGSLYNRLMAPNGGLRRLEWKDWGKLLGIVGGIVSGIVTIIGGFSAKTPANSKEAEKAGTGGILLGFATQLLAPVFLGFLIILLSFATNWILISRPSRIISSLVGGAVVPYLTHPVTAWQMTLLKTTPFRLLVGLAILIGVFGAVMSWMISTNVFSLQYLWRNRIIRAYLGASHCNRRPDRFTGFDSFDNLQMHELWPQPGHGDRCTEREDRPQEDLVPVRHSRKLFHVLNMALNLTGGEKLQWQDRRAESFTVSPLHAGSYWLGYRRSKEYGGDDGITLGASVAISGAFVSPNMGFMMTSPVVRFLMAVFNVRFGWWMGNPGPAGEDTFKRDTPKLSVLPFLAEAFGTIDDKSRYVYLSDGGHFENLGLYEMVLRRCRFIVVSDATTDPDYSFQSLAMSIRQIRVDLGVPIDIPEMAVGVPSQNLKSKYCAIGKIRYSCVDKPQGDSTPDENFDGILILIKPSLIGREPRDVINYWQGRSTFPQETITDQWFSEAQFESYRTLGSSIIDAICQDSSPNMKLESFAQRAQAHNELRFDAFREQIGLLALEHKFKEVMQDAPDSYGSKVRDFMKTVLR